MASEWYIKVSSAWKQVNEAFYKSSGAWKEVQEGWIKVGGSWKQFYTAFVATSIVTQTSNTTVSVPTGANAIHVQAAVGGGAGGVRGAEYDKSGGESGGTGGGSGAYISDKVFNVTEGETLTLTIGSGGSGATGSSPNWQGVSGTNTVLSGSTTGSMFTLGAGVAGGSTGGTSPNGTVRTNLPSSGGSATINASPVTSGTFRESNGATVTFATAVTLDDGPLGTFNQSGSGVAGVTGSNCSGDNCQIAGGNGAASYSGNISGGSGGPAGVTGGSGSRGSGGGGGGGQPESSGGAGGTGEIRYRFLRIT